MYYEAYTVFLRKHFGLGYAVKTMARLVAKELERHGRERAAHLGLAMAKGLAAPIRAVPRLNS